MISRTLEMGDVVGPLLAGIGSQGEIEVRLGS